MKSIVKTTLIMLLTGLLLGGGWFLFDNPLIPGQARAAAEAGHDHDAHAPQAEARHDDHEGHGHGSEHEGDIDDLFAEEDEHIGHGHDEHVDGVSLREGEAEEFGIELSQAGPGRLNLHVELPGEIVINGDRQAHVVPRVPGLVREVYKKLGDRVKDNELMAVLESSNLADTKAEFLAASERYDMAQLNLQREERLWQKKVSAEQEYLDARQYLAEIRIALRSAEQKLHTLGFSEEDLKVLPNQPGATYTRYEIRAPFAGTVIQKHITLGEALGTDAEVFVVADLSTVWIDISVYQKDLAAIRQGQKVTISVGHGIPDVQGVIDYIGPLIGEATRTALARVVLPNPEGALRPGMFITAHVETASLEVPLVVPKTALQTVEDETVVFIKTAEGFTPQPVKLGRTNTVNVEIVSGLKPGQTYVSKGAFTLKAQLSKGAFGDGHNH
jgi:cobalt-zinc-cadmium efflux system membrane fusion protein